MGARVIRKVNFKVKADATLANVERGMGIAVSDAAAEIVIRTSSGKDVGGGGFKPYSASYKKYRSEVLNLQTSKPNLQVTGQMLASIRHSVTAKENKVIGIIGFSDETNRAKAEGNSRYRNFFGLSKEQVTKIKETVKQAIGGK